MQTSNREFPIENNLIDILHTIEKLSIRLPLLLTKEEISLTSQQIYTLSESCKKIIQCTNNYTTK